MNPHTLISLGRRPAAPRLTTGSTWARRPGGFAALLALLAPVVVACSDGSTALTGPAPPAGPDLVPPAVDLSAAWAVSTPAAEGFDTPALDLAFAGATAAAPNLRALVAVRNGRLVREQYFGGAHADSALDLRSVTKTVTALLVGIASDRGLLDREDALVDWIQHPSLRPEHDGIRIRHLMTMTSGMQWSDAAKIGQLLLQGGRSGARQIVSKAWVETQIGRLVSLGDIGVVLADAGYGYQTWSDRSGGGAGIDAFVMWGYGGQFVWVVPDRQLVVVAATHWRGVDDRQSQQARLVADGVVKKVVAAARPVLP